MRPAAPYIGGKRNLAKRLVALINLVLHRPGQLGQRGDDGRDLFSQADFEVLRALLETLNGLFVLTINDRPETRALFADFEFQGVDVSHGITGHGATAAKELIVSFG